ncbi:hypothetical protein Y024_5788 [Burkholderia pseudomallei TSV44]|nr:hypothetical protein Y024_5788 [Burkholderia pseudomallei TSV44]
MIFYGAATLTPSQNTQKEMSLHITVDGFKSQN